MTCTASPPRDRHFTVLLRAASHVNTLSSPDRPFDARGPDLVRWDIAAPARVLIHFREKP